MPSGGRADGAQPTSGILGFMRIMFISDIFGKPGREALLARLPQMIDDHGADFVVANGENTASGAGITSKIAEKLLSGGVDVITTGNHIWRQREVFPFLDSSDRIVRPANYLPENPGRGWTVVEKNGVSLGVLNLSGNLYIGAPRGAFQTIEPLLAGLPAGVKHILLDFHAEATSEKVAMGHYLDGRVTAVIGTHTHVQTADEKILAKGTAYITDAGMTGPRNSVIGVDKRIILQRFITEMPIKFEVAQDDVWIEGVLISAGDDGRATSIERLQVAAD
ncbi:MAG: TIGR00282 family metallophosphoesterase [Actinobacteria bacterium]|nr:TIGR00282 family metallophosphoesterase [Actinomycetota bacterium]